MESPARRETLKKRAGDKSGDIRQIKIYLLKAVDLSVEVVIIKSTNPDHVRLIAEFAQNLGGEVNLIDEDDAEDYALGQLMLQKKTGNEVSREIIMAKLRA